NNTFVPPTIYERNQRFLQSEFLGVDSQAFSAIRPLQAGLGDIEVEKGASIITNRSDGLILMMGRHVVNDGYLSTPAGQVALVASSQVSTSKQTGSSDSADPNVRGLGFGTLLPNTADVKVLPPSSFYVRNEADGLIEADQGNVTLKTYATFAQQ